MAEEGADILDAVIFGVISASLSSVLLQPLDRLKTLTQQDAAASANPTRYFSKVVRTHGFLDLWRGTSPTLLRAVPGITLYFGFLQLGKNAMPQLSNAHIANFLLGSCSRTAATLLLMPATVIKTRFESSLYRDAGIKKAAKELFHQYGWRGLYRGTLPTLLRDVPFSGIYLAFYRRNLMFFEKDHTSHAPVERFGSGLIAGLCACAITQPFDMIKTHVQLFSQHSLYEFISLLYQQGGVLAFFRGFWLRATRRALMAALSWTFFDELVAERRKNRHVKITDD